AIVTVVGLAGGITAGHLFVGQPAASRPPSPSADLASDIPAADPGPEPTAKPELARWSRRNLAGCPDGSRWAISADEGIAIWNLAAKRWEAVLPRVSKAIPLVFCFSPDSKTLASGYADGAVILWDLGTRQPLHRLRGLRGMVNDIEFSADGRRLIGGSAGGTLALWDVATGNLVVPMEDRGDVVTVALSADGSTLAWGNHEGGHGFLCIDWIDSTRGIVRKSGVVPNGTQGEMQCLGLSADGRLLAMMHSRYGINLWDLAAGSRLRKLKMNAEPEPTSKSQ